MITAGFYLTFRVKRRAFFSSVCILSDRSSSGPQNGVTGEVPFEEDSAGDGLIPAGRGGSRSGKREVGLSWAVSTEPYSTPSSKITAF